MPHPHETAYPRLKSTLTDAELAEIYTPTPEEIAFADLHTQSETAKVGVLLLLKTFQRLGYFLPIAAIPQRIVHHITRRVGLVICGKNSDREVGDEELPESSWLGMVGG